MMKKRFFYSLLALVAAVWLLPQSMRADDQPFVKLAVNNGKVFGADDATYDLIFDYGTKPTSDLTYTEGDLSGQVKGKYFDLTDKVKNPTTNADTNYPAWTGYDYVNGGSNEFHYETKYKWSNRVTYAELTTAFNQAARSTSCKLWFVGCHQLTSIVNIANLKTTGVTDMSYMFAYCTNLTGTLDLNSWDVSSVTSLVAMFWECHKLETVKMDSWNTPSLQQINQLFYECTNLTSVSIKNFNVNQVTNIQQILKNCKKLKELDISTWNPSLTTLDGAFTGLSALQVLDISNFSTSKVTSIDWTFWGCSSLQTIYVGAGWDLSNVNREHPVGRDVYGDVHAGWYAAFSGCTSLVGGSGTTYAQLDTAATANPNNYDDSGWADNSTQTKKLTDSERIRASIEQLNYARPDGGTASPGLLTSTKAFAVVYDNGMTQTLYLCNRGASEVTSSSFTPENGSELTTGLTVIDNLSTMGENKWNLHSLLVAADVNVSTIDNVVIESTMGTQRPTTCANWFSGMTSLTSVTGLNYLNTTNTTSMANMFKDCSNASFTSLNFSTLPATTANVTDMSGMFEGCTNLTGITFGGNFNTSSVTTMANMFKNCSASGFTTLDLSGFATSTVTDLSGMFSGCANLQYATYADASTNTPFSIGNFDTQLVTDMHDMFSGCAHLPAEFDLSTLYTAEVTNMSGMFNGCTSLTKLNLASFATSKVTNTTNMFNGCSNLVTIYAGLTWDNTQMASSDGMFTGCSNLVGGNHTAYSSSYANKAYALIDDDEHRGYLTEMYPLFLHLYSDRDMSGALSAYNGQRVTAQVHRAFTANVWTTLCLPFNMTADQVTNVFGSGTALKTLQSVTRSGATISTVTYTDATAIEAGKPYLIKPTTAINKETGFTLSSKTILAPTGKSVNSMGFAMRGVLTPTTVSTSSTENFYTLVEDAELPANTFTAGTDYTQVTAAAPASLDGTKAYFSATTDAYVTVTIPSSGDKTYGTASFSSIYDLDFSEVEYGSNMKPEAYIGVWWTVGTTNDGTYLTMARVTDVPAGTGLLIRGTKGATYNIPISRSNVVLTNLLVAVPERKIVYEEEGDYTNYYLSGGVLKKVNGYATVGVGKAYMALPTAQLLAATPSSVSAGAPARFNLIFVDDIENYDETTGIDNVENGGDASAKKVYYNLNGQRVNNPTRGIYIVNGKKVFVK